MVDTAQQLEEIRSEVNEVKETVNALLKNLKNEDLKLLDAMTQMRVKIHRLECIVYGLSYPDRQSSAKLKTRAWNIYDSTQYQASCPTSGVG